MIKSFPSKILLFGEYGVLYGAKALAIPYQKYSGQFIFKSNYTDNRLKELSAYLIERKFNSILKLEQFKKDIHNGIKFSSTIPQNSGLGSSGALVAALFDRYAHDSIRKKPMEEIKEMMSGVESYYHLSSSGVDPMVSFTKKPLLLSENRIITVDLNLTTLPSIRFFIIDSNVEGNTNNGMKLFKNKLTQTSYLDDFKSFYTNVSNKAIGALISKSEELFWESFKELSEFQYSSMSELIPNRMQYLMDKGLSGNEFYLKILGSGGGGYFLGITRSTTPVVPNCEWLVN